MQLELTQKIVNIALDYDFYDSDIHVREGYLGRGMSKPTTGIVGLSPTDVARVVIENAGEFVDDDGDPIFSHVTFRSDSMGLSTIIY